MQKVNLDLSIIILSHNSKEHLKELLPSVFGSEGVGFATPTTLRPSAGPLIEKEGNAPRYTAKIIIVDNGSTDGTVEWVEEYRTKSESLYNCTNFQMEIIRNINTGFAHGNNFGIKQSSGKYILLLNPDTKVQPDTFKIMLDFMESRPDVGITGCKIVKPDGTLDLACRRRFPNPANSFKTLFLKDRRNYNYIGVDENQSMEVDSVVGAFLLIRRSVIEKIGLLDESFFMYGEDLDWCWRCKETGLKVWYFPRTFITHFKGASSAKTPFRSLKWFHDAMWIFYKKHYAKKYPSIFNFAVFAGVYLRLIVLTVINLFKSQPSVSG